MADDHLLGGEQPCASGGNVPGGRASCAQEASKPTSRPAQPGERRSNNVANLAGSNWGKAKAAIAAEVLEEHGTRAAEEEAGRLKEWAVEAGRQAAAADAEYQAKRAAFQQADAERASARDAYRADARNAVKSAGWHAAVQRASAAQEAMRAAREALARAQALCDLLQREAEGRGLQVAPSRAAAAAGTPAGTRRRRCNAPPETCPFCAHSYTVRDGLSSKLDAEGNRLHLRRCQCREKTPPCKNCPSCKVVPELMSVVEAEEQARLCQESYRCEICACKCPGVGKWVEGDVDSRRAFADRTEQRFGTLRAMGWGASALVPQALDAAGAAAPAPSSCTAPEAPGASVGTAAGATAPGALAPNCSLSSRGASQPRGTRSLKRLPADIRSELEQVQQELSTADVLRAWRPSPRSTPSGAAAGAAGSEGDALDATEGATAAAAFAGGGGGASCGGCGEEQQEWAKRPRRHARQAQQAWQEVSFEESRRHHHTCSHPHDECTSECCSAPHAPDHPHSHSHPPLSRHAGGLLPSRDTPDSTSLQALAAYAAQQAQHATSVVGAGGAFLGADLASAAALQFIQQVVAVGGGGLQAGGAAGLAQPSPPPELPSEVTALVDRVFLHASGPHGVQAVCAFLREQRVTSLGDLEYLELAWLCKALQPAGLPPLLLNKFLQLGRKQAAAAAAAPGGHQQQAQQAQQQEQREGGVQLLPHAVQPVQSERQQGPLLELRQNQRAG